MKALNKLYLLLSILLLNAECYSQPYVKLSFPQISDLGLKVNNDLLITHWNTENGLPQNSVNNIVQRSDGFVFFATNDGLVRFDGVRFKDYRFQDYPEMMNNRIKYIFIDKKDVIYLVTEDNNLSLFKDEKFKVIVGGSYRKNSGLYAFTKEGEVYYDDEKQQLIKYHYGETSVVRIPDLMKLSDVKKLFVINDSQMLFVKTDSIVLTDQGRTFKFKSRTTPRNYFLPEKPVNNNSFIFGHDMGLFEFKNGNIIALFESDAEIKYITGVQIENDNSYSVSSFLGFFRIKNNEIISRVNQANGLPTDFIKCVVRDSDGGLLLGSNNAGLIRLSQRFFKSYNYSQILSNQITNPIFIRKNGNLIIGTNGSGAYEFKGDELTASYFPKSHIWSILESSDNYLYFGVASNLIRVVSPEGIESEIRIPKQNDDFPIAVTTLFEEKPGKIWVGTTNGFYTYENDTVISRNEEAGVDFKIHDIKMDEQGLIWMAGEGGLIRYDGKSYKIFGKQVNQGLYFLRTIFLSDNEIWIGSYGNGLINYKNGKFTRITHRNGLFDNSISSIYLDNKGIFWFSSNKGIFAVSKPELDNVIDGKDERVSFIKFGRNDGMISRECNGGFTPSSAVDKNGVLYIPTINGVVYFDPLIVKKERLKTPVIIEGYEINNTFFHFNDTKLIELPFGNDRITFYVNSPYLNDNHNLLYKYKLEGFSDSWVWQSYINNVISFTSLPPGKYKLHVKAYYAFRENDANEISVEIIVLPPFYQTGSFIFFSVLSLLGIVVLIIRLRERALKRKRKELENIVNERTFELSEKNKQLENLNIDLAVSKEELLLKNKTLSQREGELVELNESKDLFMTIISHDLRNPLFSISSFADILEDEEEELTKSERNEMLGKIKTLSKNLYELLNNLLAWAKIQGGKTQIDADIFDLNQLVQENLNILQGVANQKAVHISAELNQTLPLAYADKPMIASVIQNLITNAVKFSHPDSDIQITTASSDDFLRVSVKDSGVGIPESMKDKLFRIDSKTTTRGTGNEKGSGVGLILSHEIIQKNGGRIWFNSTEGKGTTFYFTIPSVRLYHKTPGN